MRRAITAITIFIAFGGVSMAQESAHNPAIKSPAPAATTMPAKGANSYTKNQARSRMAKAGYPGVTALVKNLQGQWVGSTMKGGVQMTVMLDYKGDVTAR